LSNNKLCFDDLEPYIGTGLSTFNYDPQANIGDDLDTTISGNTSFTISVSVGGSANSYQWTKNGNDIVGAVDTFYTIENAAPADAGYYVCRVTSSIVTGLELFAGSVFVEVGTTGLIPEGEASLPEVFAIYQNYPNPFNPVTTIRYDVGGVGAGISPPVQIDLSIYNVLGKKVATLVSEKQSPGWHRVQWDATGFPSGIYLYKLSTSQGFSQTKKLVLLR